MSDFPQLEQSSQLQPAPVPQIQQTISGAGKAFLGMTNAVAQTVDQVQDEKLDAEKEGAILQIRNGLMEIKNKTLDPRSFNANIAVDSYDKQAKALIQGVLGKVNQRVRGKVANSANYYAFSGREIITNHVQAIHTQQLREGFDEAINSKMTDASNAAFNAGTSVDLPAMVQRENAAKLKAQSHQLIQNALGSGLISGSYAANLKQTFNQTLQEQSYYGGLSQAMKAGKPQEFLQAFQKADHSDMTDKEKQNIELNMNRQIEIYKQNNDITADKFNNSVADLTYNLQNRSNSIANKQDRDKVLSTAQEWFPSQYDKVKQSVDEAEKTGAMVQATKYARPDVALNIAQKYAPNPGESGIAQKSKAYNQALSIIENNNKAFINDPAGYLEAHPSVVAAKNAFAYNHTTDWVAPLLNVERTMGASPNPPAGGPGYSIIPKQVAQSLVNQFYGTDPLDQVRAINSVVMQYDPTSKISANGELQPGKYEHIVLNDLHKNGLPTSTAMFYGITQNKDAQSMVPVAAQALMHSDAELTKALEVKGIKLQDVKTYVQNNLEDFSNSLSGYQGDIEGELGSSYDLVYKMAAVMASKGMDPKDAAEKAADGAINSNFGYGSLNGHTYRFPKEMSGGRVTRALIYMAQQAKDSQLSVPIGYENQGDTPEIAEKLYNRDVANHSYFVTTPDNQGLQLVDRDGIKVTSKDGVPFIINFDELKNMQSPISQAVDTHTFWTDAYSPEQYFKGSGIPTADIIKLIKEKI